MSGRPWTRAGIIVVAALGVYLLAYLAMLERKVFVPVAVDPRTGRNVHDIEPQYRIPALSRALYPIHRLDRLIRYDYWTTIEKESGHKWKNPAPSR